MKLGRIEQLDVRSHWQDEARDFTPWLAKEPNIQVLADEIGVDLEVERTEVPIGSYKADIVARDSDGRKVIIENQLNKTDHKHLGQLITYASGLDASLIIWICKEVTDEHRQAVDWLNEIASAADVAFFACEIELWQIGDSLPAPKFNIISSPNDWSKTVRSTGSIETLSTTQQLHLEFWNSFKEFMTEAGSDLSLQTPRSRHWYQIAVGRSKFSIVLTANTQVKRIGCEIYVRGEKAKVAFSLLKREAEAIEQELGQLDWQELPEGQDCRIIKYRNGNSKNRHEWPDLHQWLKENAEAFYTIFSPRIKRLNLDIE